MFRDEEDHGMFVNLMALRGYALDTEIMADAEMSNHVHLGIFSDNPMKFAAELRRSYTRFFNTKWGRKGRFGEKYTYLNKVEGFYHQMVAQNYINRNGLHHGAAATAFGYKYCSVREMFADDIGKSTEVARNWSRAEIASFLPRRSEFPDNYQMDANGIFLRRSFMELRRAEQYYVTPRNYLYQMNRLTDESWKTEQEQDKTGKPITLNLIERADENTLTQLLSNERARNFSSTRMQDMDVCRLIDNDLLPSYGTTSVYRITDSQRQRIARQLYHEFHLPEAQIRRCLVLP